MRSIIKNKKGQEEIIGFVLVIILVLVVGLFLLMISKPKASEEKDNQLDGMLSAILGTTLDGRSIADRIANCESGSGCEIFQGNVTGIIDLAFSKGGLVLGRNIKGRDFEIAGGMEFSYMRGNTTSNSIAATPVVVKNSLVGLRVYY